MNTNYPQNIYIVDDDDSVRKSLKRLLEIGGFEIHTFDSAFNLLSNITTDTVGCLILDVKLPDMGGD